MFLCALSTREPYLDHKSPHIVNEVANSLESAGREPEFKTGKFFFLLGLLVISSLFILLFFCYNKIWLLYLSTMTFMTFSMVLAEHIFPRKEKLTNQITFVTTAMGFTIMIAFYDIRKTEDSPQQFETTIIDENKTVSTSSNLIYVGKTTNYIFLYDRTRRESQVLKTEGVKAINTKSKS